MTLPNRPLLNANLRWFLAGMILANIAGQMLYSMLSLYMINLGAQVAEVGLVFTLASLVPMALQIFGGWLSDTIGRLRVMALGSSIAVFGYAIIALATSWEWVLLGLSVEYVSNSVVGPSFGAYISEQSDESQRGRVFGVTSSIYMTVTVIGPALAGLLANRFGFKFMMSVALAFYFAATIVRVWMATSEHFAAKQDAEKPTWEGFRTQISAVFTLLLAGGILTWIWITDAIGDTAANMIDQLTPIYLSDIGSLNVEQIGYINAVRGLAVIIVSPLAGRLVDRSSERVSIVAGFILQAIGMSLFLFSETLVGFGAAMLFSGAAVGCLIPGYDSLISKVVPEERRGLAFGLFGTTLGILSLPMPWIGAQLWERYSPQTPYSFVFIACLISIIIVWSKFRLPKQSEDAAVASSS
ncbi:MAG TPA: MFS transporter [Anaerolineales bacterium]|nr:MFS transporter [Anaerolineales bacterium]